jgi:hypothetical protein
MIVWMSNSATVERHTFTTLTTHSLLPAMQITRQPRQTRLFFSHSNVRLTSDYSSQCRSATTVIAHFAFMPQFNFKPNIFFLNSKWSQLPLVTLWSHVSHIHNSVFSKKKIANRMPSRFISNRKSHFQAAIDLYKLQHIGLFLHLATNWQFSCLRINKRFLLFSQPYSLIDS